jgi:DNA-binding transcriptional MocR family regulator
MWIPQNLATDKPIYRAIVDCLARDVAAGKLADGTRLPTVRQLSHSMAINMGTVYRAYSLAQQRGLLIKEVGRGSFVRYRPVHGMGDRADLQGSHAGVDLTRNEPPFLPLDALLRQSLKDIARDSVLDGMMEYGHSQGLSRHREMLCSWLAASQGFSADPDKLIITGGAQQGLTIALGALSNPGDTLLVEDLSYPGVRNLARFFGLSLKSVALDDEGLVPDALDRACVGSGAKVLYCMPHAHNPTTATMSRTRRVDVMAVIEKHGLMVIEDDVNTHATRESYQPLAALPSDRVVYISSLSKIVAPGLRVGMIVAPERVYAEVYAASQTTSWMAPPLMAELACLWIRNGNLQDIVQQRVVLSGQLLSTAQQIMGDVPYCYHQANPHLWLPLPSSRSSWSSREFAEMALARGVSVSPANQFSTDQGTTNPGVRMCLRELPGSQLQEALQKIVALYHEAPRPQAFSM